jgi:hypothetical protein
VDANFTYPLICRYLAAALAQLPAPSDAAID